MTRLLFNKEGTLWPTTTQVAAPYVSFSILPFSYNVTSMWKTIVFSIIPNISISEMQPQGFCEVMVKMIIASKASPGVPIVYKKGLWSL